MSVKTIFTQPALESGSLLLGELADGRTASDHGIMVLYTLGTGAGDELRQRLAPDAREGKINDVWIAK